MWHNSWIQDDQKLKGFGITREFNDLDRHDSTGVYLSAAYTAERGGYLLGTKADHPLKCDPKFQPYKDIVAKNKKSLESAVAKPGSNPVAPLVLLYPDLDSMYNGPKTTPGNHLWGRTASGVRRFDGETNRPHMGKTVLDKKKVLKDHKTVLVRSPEFFQHGLSMWHNSSRTNLSFSRSLDRKSLQLIPPPLLLLLLRLKLRPLRPLIPHPLLRVPRLVRLHQGLAVPSPHYLFLLFLRSIATTT